MSSAQESEETVQQRQSGAGVLERITDRRKIGVSFLALAAGTLLAKTAGAFPHRRRRAELLESADRLLEPFGLQVFDSSGDHDTLTVRALPAAGTEYDFVVASSLSSDVPQIKTTFFDGQTLFEHFDPELGAIDPCFKTGIVQSPNGGDLVTAQYFDLGADGTAAGPSLQLTVDGAVRTFDQFDPTQSIDIPVAETSITADAVAFVHFDPLKSGINPCFKTTVGGGDVTTFEKFDPALGSINPCFKTGIIENPNGNDLITVQYFDLDANGAAAGPSIQLTIDGAVRTFDEFDPTQSTDIPVARTSIDAGAVAFEHFDPLKSGIKPCFRTAVTGDGALTTFEHFADTGPNGAVGNPDFVVSVSERDSAVTPITVTVNDPNADFSVVIGDRMWKLVGGELVEVQ